MSLFIASLNSGSNGNCYYIGTQEEAVLVDGGISCRETEKRLKRLGLNARKIKAIFVTHEHGDHIHGVANLSKKFKLPVYITERTLQNGNVRLVPELVNPFQAHQKITLGNLIITPFPKFHDAADPHSFLITHEQVTVGVFTDIGAVCEHVIHHFSQCHAAFLESNYDEAMLEHGRYPYALKNRIRNGHGHLSNHQAAELFIRHRPSFMTHLILSHLSRNNNKPTIVETLFRKIAGETKIVIASRQKESRLFHIRHLGDITEKKKAPDERSQQLTLF